MSNNEIQLAWTDKVRYRLLVGQACATSRTSQREISTTLGLSRTYTRQVLGAQIRPTRDCLILLGLRVWGLDATAADEILVAAGFKPLLEK